MNRKILDIMCLIYSSTSAPGKRKSKSVKVDIPAGVDTGMTLKIGGQGEEGPSGKPPGDLFVVIEVANDTYFKRDGEDVIVDIPISVTQVR